MTGTIEAVEDHGTLVGVVIDGDLLCGDWRATCDALLSLAPDGAVIGLEVEYDTTDWGGLAWLAPLDA